MRQGSISFRPPDALRARADRAIAHRLLATEALLTSYRHTLRLTGRSLQLSSQLAAPDSHQQLVPLLTAYHQRHGRLQERTKRLGQDIDRVVVTRIAVA